MTPDKRGEDYKRPFGKPNGNPDHQSIATGKDHHVSDDWRGLPNAKGWTPTTLEPLGYTQLWNHCDFPLCVEAGQDLRKQAHDKDHKVLASLAQLEVLQDELMTHQWANTLLILVYTHIATVREGIIADALYLLEAQTQCSQGVSDKLWVKTASTVEKPPTQGKSGTFRISEGQGNFYAPTGCFGDLF
ncbi:hypothetical protein GGX14DRAFT_399439 [Mycena pura]|uniref:Uncharacterized protein n=1 Tax=Mycena pura TaxID=153505 RepID=A0AAD6Y8I7_9AGAR|nr:hypothetical protein GGX14DRAFT_399439 [Mycena pura]